MCYSNQELPRNDLSWWNKTSANTPNYSQMVQKALFTKCLYLLFFKWLRRWNKSIGLNQCPLSILSAIPKQTKASSQLEINYVKPMTWSKKDLVENLTFNFAHSTVQMHAETYCSKYQIIFQLYEIQKTVMGLVSWNNSCKIIKMWYYTIYNTCPLYNLSY